MIAKVIAFAQTQGYDGAEHKGKWKKYDVYEPTFNGDDPAFVGLPFIILVDGDEVRMSSEGEAFEYLDTLPDD